MIVFFLIHCTKFANLKYLQNLIIKRNFKNSKNMTLQVNSLRKLKMPSLNTERLVQHSKKRVIITRTMLLF